MDSFHVREQRIGYINRQLTQLRIELGNITGQPILDDNQIARHHTAREEPYSIIGVYYFPRQAQFRQKEIIHEIIAKYMELEDTYAFYSNEQPRPQFQYRRQ